MQKFNISTVGCLAVVLALTAATGCSSFSSNRADGRSSDQANNDNRITDEVESRLNREPVFKFNEVDVKTFGGVVQLSGFVNSNEQKQRAGEIAQNVLGVQRVDNAITLKPTDALTPTGRTYNVPVHSTNNAPVNTNTELDKD